MDGATNLKGRRVGVILEGSNEVLVEPSLSFSFKAN